MTKLFFFLQSLGLFSFFSSCCHHVIDRVKFLSTPGVNPINHPLFLGRVNKNDLLFMLAYCQASSSLFLLCKLSIVYDRFEKILFSFSQGNQVSPSSFNSNPILLFKCLNSTLAFGGSPSSSFKTAQSSLTGKFVPNFIYQKRKLGWLLSSLGHLKRLFLAFKAYEKSSSPAATSSPPEDTFFPP